MNDEVPYYQRPRVLLLIFIILGSIAAIMPSYSNGEFQTNLKYGLDLEGGSWLQLRLQGVVVQVDANENKIILNEFGRLLDDPTIKVDEVTQVSATFTTSKEVTKKTIDSYGFGSSNISKNQDGSNRITIQTNKIYLMQKYLENNLNAEVIPIPGNFIRFEIRKSITEAELNDVLKPVDGKIPQRGFTEGVSPETISLTKDILDKKFNQLGLKEIPIRTVGNNYILIDLAGVDMTTARDIAAKPGKFEVRIQVEGNQTEHVLYGDQITGVGVPQKESRDNWGVSFTLTDKGAEALRDAAIQYGAVTKPEAHYLSMYLDGVLVFDAPLARELARNIQSIPVKNMVATTGQGDVGQ
ncbi:MAG: preprotein translocase subunit SecD, partial [Candidatus Methanoperedens sp.]|nr:preprotein translocase subunit SecD [Candidatus Methanoperedens sp.]